MQTLSLVDFIHALGDEQAAAVLGVKPRTVQSWRRAERMPRTRDIPLLIERSGGRLTHASFFGLGHEHVA